MNEAVIILKVSRISFVSSIEVSPRRDRLSFSIRLAKRNRVRRRILQVISSDVKCVSARSKRILIRCVVV